MRSAKLVKPVRHIDRRKGNLIQTLQGRISSSRFVLFMPFAPAAASHRPTGPLFYGLFCLYGIYSSVLRDFCKQKCTASRARNPPSLSREGKDQTVRYGYGRMGGLIYTPQGQASSTVQDEEIDKISRFRTVEDACPYNFCRKPFTTATDGNTIMPYSQG